MKEGKIVAEILKEIDKFDHSDWNQDENEFNCLIYREDSGDFKCCLRSHRSSASVELVLTHDGIEASVDEFNKSDKNNKIIKIFYELVKHFKEKSTKERKEVLDAFLNKA